LSRAMVCRLCRCSRTVCTLYVVRARRSAAAVQKAGGEGNLCTVCVVLGHTWLCWSASSAWLVVGSTWSLGHLQQVACCRQFCQQVASFDSWCAGVPVRCSSCNVRCLCCCGCVEGLPGCAGKHQAVLTLFSVAQTMCTSRLAILCGRLTVFLYRLCCTCPALQVGCCHCCQHSQKHAVEGNSTLLSFVAAAS
jgi:hypothetical protein